MNLKNILKIYKKANEDKTVINPASALISVGQSEIDLDIPGVPSVIEITYKGICNLGNLLPMTFKVNLLKNKIVIVNVFKKDIPKTIFNYTGKIEITDCEILTFTGNRFKATINNNELQEIIDGQRTKVEDDTMIIHEQYEEKFTIPFKRGIRSGSFISAVTETKKKISGMSKEERFNLKETVVRTLVGKSKISKPEKQQVVRPSPTASPAKTPPKTTTSSVKKGGY